MITEYVGVTQDVASAIERHRQDATETKNDILRRILPADETETPKSASKILDIGQGVYLEDGEVLYLFLSKPREHDPQAAGKALVRNGKLYLGDEPVVPSHGSVIAPAMQAIQRRVGHTDAHGKPISLSAFRQWHVVRDRQLVPLDDLKDPKLRRTRARHLNGIDLSSIQIEL